MTGQMTGVRERKRRGGPSTPPHIPGISLAEAVGVGCRRQSLAEAGHLTGHLGLCQPIPLPRTPKLPGSAGLGCCCQYCPSKPQQPVKWVRE